MPWKYKFVYIFINQNISITDIIFMKILSKIAFQILEVLIGYFCCFKNKVDYCGKSPYFYCQKKKWDLKIV